MRQFRSTVVLLLFVLCFSSAFAESYPSHAIKIVQPWAPGAISETVLRLVADRLSTALKQPVVIENRPGVGSTLGTDYVAKSIPDGYTLIATFNSSIAPGPLMYNKMAYDPVKDFTHLVLIGVYPQYITVKADYPAKTLQEFMAMAKAKPGAINYASAGVGTSGFLAIEMLKQSAGLNMIHVPYKGPSPAIIDLLGGRLDMVITASGGELARSGKARVLAASSEKRVAAYPDVPTINEIVPGVSAVSWIGISVPAKTPHAIADRLERELLAILRSPDLQARLSEPAIGLTPMALGSEQFLEFIQKENRVWAPVIKAGNIKVGM